MSLRRYWRNITKNEWVVRFGLFIKNIGNKEFYSRKYKFKINSYGLDNKGTCIYKIWIDGGEGGFFALQRFFLDGLFVAQMSGFVPFVLVTNTKYNDIGGLNDNLFSYYYEQPAGLTLESVQNSFFVADFELDHRRWLEDEYQTGGSFPAGYEFESELIEKLAQIKSKYIRFKPMIAEQLEHDCNELLCDGSKVLGIHFRGNAYKVGLKDHPVGLDPDDYYPYIDEALQKGYDRIFIATDDVHAIDSFSSRYKDKLLYYEDTTRSSDGIDVHEPVKTRVQTGRQLGYEVLRDMITLSKCDGLLCGKSQVSFAVLIEKQARLEEFDYLEIIDKGVYANNSKKAKRYMHRIHKNQ